MSYEVRMTGAAQRDVQEAVGYIEHVLLNPQAALDLVDEVASCVDALSEYPARFAIADDAVLKMWQIRFAPINNYLLFYCVDEQRACVQIVRFLYSKRNWISILRQGYML
ncbi:MAG: type II toxin-antitoxin system RelE/ParE family toxin [Clostridia bacterium]|nr:type II toxin-antitoxin system RelE/ParE family toxin [Clostridia bacterium]